MKWTEENQRTISFEKKEHQLIDKNKTKNQFSLNTRWTQFESTGQAGLTIERRSFEWLIWLLINRFQDLKYI